MCGLSGIVYGNNAEYNREEIKKMNSLIDHRGPDDEGYYFGEDFAFGHRRLAILDLSSSGHQPMKYLEKYVIIHNGEIYNYLELKKELSSAGYTFKSQTDTEVIMAAYDAWGTDCVNRFVGMWAFALYDMTKDLIFCSRDRFGIKPFYYTEINNRFIFGSEIKQLLLFYDVNRVNVNILLDFLIADLEDHTEETFFTGIHKLQQGHNLIYNLKSHSYRIEKYFFFEAEGENSSSQEEDAVHTLRKSLDRAIELRLRSDVTVGTCLSGGLDSSSIAAIASEKYTEKNHKKFIAIHAKSVEPRTDESFFAKKVAGHCDLDLHIVTPSLDMFSDYMNEIVYVQEEPFGSLSIFMQYFVMQKAKEISCKVLLDGQGGDESFAGYEFYYSYYLASFLKKLRIIRFFKEFKKIKTSKFSKKEMLLRVMLALSFRLRILKYARDEKKLGLKVRYNNKRLKHFFQINSLKEIQLQELLYRKLPHLLKYEDKNAMRHSIETRLPFVDHILVMNAVRYDDELKMKNGYLKYLLRKVIEDKLPEEVVWRTSKFGFEAPSGIWITENRQKMISSIQGSSLLNKIFQLNENLLGDHKYLWKLYIISVWEKAYQVVL